MRQRLVRLIVLGLLLVGTTGLVQPPRAVAAFTYQVRDLGTLPGDFASVAMGINQFGHVVGWSYGPTGTRAFVYTDAGGMTALPAPAGRPVTAARAISSTGYVVGTASTGGSDIGQAVVWHDGVARLVGTLGTGMFSEARGVNAGGVTVGTRTRAAEACSGSTPSATTRWGDSSTSRPATTPVTPRGSTTPTRSSAGATAGRSA